MLYKSWPTEHGDSLSHTQARIMCWPETMWFQKASVNRKVPRFSVNLTDPEFILCVCDHQRHKTKHLVSGLKRHNLAPIALWWTLSCMDSCHRSIPGIPDPPPASLFKSEIPVFRTHDTLSSWTCSSVRCRWGSFTVRRIRCCRDHPSPQCKMTRFWLSRCGGLFKLRVQG